MFEEAKCTYGPGTFFIVLLDWWLITDDKDHRPINV